MVLLTFKKVFVSWVIWMLVGLFYYKYEYKCSWQVAFYNTVSIGYNVGWGYPYEATTGQKILSSFNLLLGAAATTASIQFFMESMVAKNKKWIVDSLTQEKLDVEKERRKSQILIKKPIVRKKHNQES